MTQSRIFSIGITGGVGAGKSAILDYIKKHYRAGIIIADKVAHALEAPGQPCFAPLVLLLGKDVLTEEGEIDAKKMARMIFSDETLLTKVNAIVHPAVKTRILAEIGNRRQAADVDFVFVEAALLIEDGYEDLLDTLWYIDVGEKERGERLSADRGYSAEKTKQIMDSQLSREEYLRHANVVIDNGGSFADTCRQVDEKLEGYLCQR